MTISIRSCIFGTMFSALQNINRGPVWVLALVFVIAGGGLPMGLALCIGDDGHVAIEAFAPSGKCEDTGSSDLAWSAPDGDHCGTCLDVASVIQEGSLTSRYDFAVFDIASHYALEPHYDASARTSNQSIQTIHPQYPSLFLRSNILLI